MLERVRFGGRLRILLVAAVVLLVGIGAAGMVGGQKLAGGVEALYGHRVVALGELARMLDAIHRVRAGTIEVVQSESRLTLARVSKDIEAEDKEIDTLWARFSAREMSEDQRAQADAFGQSLQEFRAGTRHTLDLFGQGDFFSAREASGSVNSAYDDATMNLRGLMDLAIHKGGEDFGTAMATYRAVRTGSLAAITAGVLALAAISMWIARSITGPIAAVIGVMGRLVEGDAAVVIEGTARRDEIGDIARAVNTFKQHALEVEWLRAAQVDAERRAAEERRAARMRLATEFDATVRGVVDSVSRAVARMEAAAHDLQQVSSAASDNAVAAGSAASQASANVESVAAATEELSSSIAEIGRRVAESSSIAAEAVSRSQESNTIMGGLAAAANRIGEVVGIITDIAAQTNLLALNATIEAARAGEAGKGFAVVAGEVKTLANQTARATDDIGLQVAAVQGEATRAMEAIRHIGGVLDRMNSIASSIAAAVEQQVAATREIARNIDQAATGTREVSRNVDGAVVAARSTGEASVQVLETANGLSNDAAELGRAVDSFVARMGADG